MARRCMALGKRFMSGHNVSHANNKTHRRFLINLQSKRLMSDTLNQMIRVRISAHGLRTIEKMGGLDAFLTRSTRQNLDTKMLSLKRRVERKMAQTQPQHA